MSVSTVNGERNTEIRWTDEYGTPLRYAIATYAGPGWASPTSDVHVSPDAALALHPPHLHITDPEVHDEIARAHAHAAATLRGDLATKRGGEVLGKYVGTPDGAVIADSLDRAREASS